MNRRNLLRAGTFAAALAVGLADVRANLHTTNGAFDANEWTVANTPGSPLAKPSTTAAQTFGFDPISSRGGATLYVEQATGRAGGLQAFGTTLNLMYDYTSSPVVLGPTSNASNSSIDVFFEVPNDDDYVVHITAAGFTAFEKPNGVVSPENADGTLHFMTPGGAAVAPWSVFNATDPDFALAAMHASLGFGTSPNSPVPHLIAEFDLSINSTGGSPAGGGNPGLYDPAPAFWSASGKSGTIDPPFSSEIFDLQADGTTLTAPVFNAAGNPVSQPSSVPEPASIGLVAAGACVAALRRRRR